MDFALFTQKLRQQLFDHLPGEAAQFKMAPARRLSWKEYYELGSRNPRKSAVLVCIYPMKGSIFTALMLRPSMQGIHSDQVSFPGGRFEEGDVDLKGTALREAEEEVGINAQNIHIIGEMTKVYIPVSNSLVHPFVGISPLRPEFQPNPNEVSAIIEAELKSLLNPAIKGSGIFPAIGAMNIEAPFYNISNHRVWGATAMILSEMESLLTDFADF